MNIREKYTVETEKYTSPSQEAGTCYQLRCSVMELGEDGEKTKIGEYFRNYYSLDQTWEPFEQNGKAYALCSPNYTGTSVLALPSCEILASEPEVSTGFCPTGFYVPQDKEVAYENYSPMNGRVGFVCGCLWGDDTSMKVEFLDLSDIENGNIGRDARFGYLELPSYFYFDKVLVGEDTTHLKDYITIRHTSADGSFRVSMLVSHNLYVTVPYEACEKL